MEVLVNVGMSADGKLSTSNRERISISGPHDFERLDEIRASVDGILIGRRTLQADDPRLTVKNENRRCERIERRGSPNPAKIVAATRGDIPLDANIFDGSADTIILVSELASTDQLDRIESVGGIPLVAGAGDIDLGRAFEKLEARGIERLLIEGGGTLIFSAFDAGLVDELITYVGPILIGGAEAPTLADGDGFDHPDDFASLRLKEVTPLDDGVLLSWSVRK